MYATPPIDVYDLRIRITAEDNILKKNPYHEKSNDEHEKKSTGLRNFNFGASVLTIKCYAWSRYVF